MGKRKKIKKITDEQYLSYIAGLKEMYREKEKVQNKPLESSLKKKDASEKKE